MSNLKSERFQFGSQEIVFVKIIKDHYNEFIKIFTEIFQNYLSVDKVKIHFDRYKTRELILQTLKHFERREPDALAYVFTKDKELKSPIPIFIEVETTGSSYMFLQCRWYDTFGAEIAIQEKYLPLHRLKDIPFVVIIAVHISEEIIEKLSHINVPVIQIFPVNKNIRNIFQIDSSQNNIMTKLNRILIDTDMNLLKSIINDKNIAYMHKIFILSYVYKYGDKNMKADIDAMIPLSNEKYIEQKAVGELNHDYIKYLTPEQIAALHPDQIAALTPQQIADLTDRQIAALTPQQIAALTPQQIKALTPQQIKALTPQQIEAIPLEKFDGISPERKIELIKRFMATASSEMKLEMVEILLKDPEVRRSLKKKDTYDDWSQVMLQ